MQLAVLLWPHANKRYFQSVRALAQGELTLMLSTRDDVGEPQFKRIGGLELLCFSAGQPDARLLALLGRMSSLYALFRVEGEALYPLEWEGLRFGNDLSGILKYKGKTNEMFTGMLVNVAVFSSQFAQHFDGPLHLLDPLCGRGTTLFEALRRGYHATGVEIDTADVAELNKFFRKYCEHTRLKHSVENASMTVAGRPSGKRTRYTVGEDAAALRGNARTLTVLNADTVLVRQFYKTPTFHALAADLPYGIQHESRDGKNRTNLDQMMRKALASWKAALLPGAGVALSFNSYTLPLQDARALLREAGYTPLTGGVYDGFAHWVEQAVNRDIVVAQFPGK